MNVCTALQSSRRKEQYELNSCAKTKIHPRLDGNANLGYLVPTQLPASGSSDQMKQRNKQQLEADSYVHYLKPPSTNPPSKLTRTSDPKLG